MSPSQRATRGADDPSPLDRRGASMPSSSSGVIERAERGVHLLLLAAQGRSELIRGRLAQQHPPAPHSGLALRGRRLTHHACPRMRSTVASAAAASSTSNSSVRAPIGTLGAAGDPFGDGLTFSSGKRAERPP